MSNVERRLKAIQDGNPPAADELLPLVCAEMCQLVRAKMDRG